MSMTQPQPQQTPKAKRFFPEFSADHTVLPYDPDGIASTFNDYIADHTTTLGPDAVAAIVNEHTNASIPSYVVEQAWEEIDDLSKTTPISVLMLLMNTHAITISSEEPATTSHTQSTTTFFDIVDSTKNAVTHVSTFVVGKLNPRHTTHVTRTPTTHDERDS